MNTPEQIAQEIVERFSWSSNVSLDGRLVGQQVVVAKAIAMAIRKDRQEYGNALRILGASDGYASAMVHLRNGELGALVGRYAPRIDQRHTRKRAARDAIVAPLRRVEKWLNERRSACSNAYAKIIHS